MRLSMKLLASGAIVGSLIAAACSGGTHAVPSSNAGAPGSLSPNSGVVHAVATATLTPPPFSGSALSTYYGHYDKNHVYHYPIINGTNNEFNPMVGDSSSGGHGPVNSTFDGVTCYKTMSSNYHIHAFVGLYVNGVEYAIPRGLGAVEPTSPAPSILYATQCFYSVHTHDSTGIVHIEDFNNGVVEKPPLSTKYNVGQIFGIYGITVTPTNFGPFTGEVRVFTSGQQFRHIDPSAGGTIPESTMRQWTGDPSTVPLYDHEVLWYMVGPAFPTSLPSIDFAPGY